MVLKRTVMSSISLAAMGLALTGAAYGQVNIPEVAAPGVAAPPTAAPGVTAPGVADGAITRNEQLNADAATNAQAPAVDAASAAAVNGNKNGVDTKAGAQINEIQAGANAAAGTKGQSINSNVNSNANAGVNSLQNQANASQNANAAATLNPFGATFNSNTTDSLVIQNLQANSVASRLGLQARDRIINVNGQAYTDGTLLDQDLAKLNANTDMPITYERNGVRYTQNFRLSSQNGQQGFNGSTYGNQPLNHQSINSQQISYSANRPTYDMAGNSMNYSTIASNHGSMGGVAAYGSHSYQGYSGRHHGGRRHRHCCR